MHKKLAMDMFPHYLSTCKSVTSNKAILKCKINYTMLTVINKYLDTAQIKMCNNWKYIDFNNVTSKIAFTKIIFYEFDKTGEIGRTF